MKALHNNSIVESDSNTTNAITAEQMGEINLKLKIELSQLIEKLENALQKFKERKERGKMRTGVGATVNPAAYFSNNSAGSIPNDLL